MRSVKFHGHEAQAEVWAALLGDTLIRDGLISGTSDKRDRVVVALLEAARDELGDAASDMQVIRRAISLDLQQQLPRAIARMAQALERFAIDKSR